MFSLGAPVYLLICMTYKTVPTNVTKKNSLRGQNSPAGSKYGSRNIQYFKMSNIRKNDYHEK